MLNGTALEKFLSESWRRKPHVFRGAIDVSAYPIDADTVRSLTDNDLIESRVITSDLDLAFGPFDAEYPMPDGLLLVQCLEQHLDAARQLLDDEFSFLPRWQIDDLMVSLGDDSASCGAHFDQYDVFLVQHTGSKTWQLDTGDHQETELRTDLDIRVLEDFEPTETFTVEPGDVLYLPPGVGHHGINIGESMTLSVGIRNPSASELLAEISEFALDDLTEFKPLEDNLHAADSGITPDITQALTTKLSEMLSTELLTRWYGCYVTRLRESELLQPVDVPDFDIRNQLTLKLASRATHALIDDRVLLFVNGECYPLDNHHMHWITELTTGRKVKLPDNLDEDACLCIEQLIASGAAQFEDTDER